MCQKYVGNEVLSTYGSQGSKELMHPTDRQMKQNVVLCSTVISKSG